MDPLAVLIIVGMGWGMFEILRYGWHEERHAAEVEELANHIARTYGGATLRDHARIRYPGMHPLIFYPTVGVFLLVFLFADDVSLWFFAGLPAVLLGNYYRPVNKLVANHLRANAAMGYRPQKHVVSASTQSAPDFGSASSDDEYFSRHKGSWSEAGFHERPEWWDAEYEYHYSEDMRQMETKAQQEREDKEQREREAKIRREVEAKVRREYEARQTQAPRGFEKRHPDDKNLWAMVDDPSASPEERAAAMRKIGSREKKRGGGAATA